MFDDITILEALAGFGVLAAIYIVIQLSQANKYIESTRRHQQAHYDAETKSKRLVEEYLKLAQFRDHAMERLEAVATYRRLAADLLRDEFKDFPEEFEEFLWTVYDEQNHALGMAELRHEKQHLEEMASLILSDSSITKEPWDSLMELKGPSDSELNDYFPLPKALRINELEPPRTLTEQLAEEEREANLNVRLDQSGAESSDGE